MNNILNKPTVSIIIVHYHVKDELFACIKSILASKSKVNYEIIVVDNDEKKTLSTSLKNKFPKVIYIPNNNKGFGEGNNVGAKRAKGEYLFFLNPDTELFPHAINKLFSFFEKNKEAGIVAPLLFSNNGKPYQQGALELTPQRGIVTLSFINKVLPKNPISRAYYLKDWDKQTTKEVDVVPGTAFMIRKNIFKKLGGFDDKFFLYFEEFDFCKRMKELGLKLFIYPEAKAFHHWGASTQRRTDINKIFNDSRFYYFRKHFGIFSALVTETILRINKYSLGLSLFVVTGFLLRLLEIDQTMQFIGDQGWFYLSARDMVLSGQIPLVGIASSHPWLHQGALWIYMLAGWFSIFGFNPINGAYLTAALDILAIILFYKLGSALFSRRLGLIVASLYATSPLIIFLMRMPYHTSPIPLFTIIFILFLYKWISGKVHYFPFVIGALGILYNLEIATFVFSCLVFGIILVGLWKKYLWVTRIFRTKILMLSLLAFLISMLPMLVYDFHHGFPQTVRFLAWVGYKILVVFGYPPLTPSTPVSWNTIFVFAVENYVRLIFPASIFVATIIILGSIGFFIESVKQMLTERKFQLNMVTVSLVTIIPIGGFFAVRTPSDAYLPMVFPGLLLLTGLFFDGFFSYKRLKLVGFALVCIMIIGNTYFAVANNYSVHKGTDVFTDRLTAAKQIVTEAAGKEYNLKGTGRGSQFESFTMNYEYLAWWLGHGPSHQPQELKLVIEEKLDRIEVIKQYD